MVMAMDGNGPEMWVEMALEKKWRQESTATPSSSVADYSSSTKQQPQQP